MKSYLFLLLLAFGLCTSCSLDDGENTQFHLEVMPIESIDMPEQFVYGQDYIIGLHYTRPNACYFFNDVVYNIVNNERIISVVNSVYNSTDIDCTENPEPVTAELQFTVTSTETYIFKFFQGEDANGIDQYHIIEVPIVEQR